MAASQRRGVHETVSTDKGSMRTHLGHLGQMPSNGREALRMVCCQGALLWNGTFKFDQARNIRIDWTILLSEWRWKLEVDLAGFLGNSRRQFCDLF